jgi:hypothetical protein
VIEAGLANLLAECRQPVYAATPTAAPFEPCDDLTFSADGRYLAFFFGPEGCGRGIMIVDLVSDQTLYRITDGGIAFEFLANGKILISTGYCEGGDISLLDPATSELKTLGNWAKTILWSPSRAAFVVTPTAYHGFESAIWGYNVARDLVFLEQPGVWQIDDRPLWAPDGTHLVFQHRPIIEKDGTYAFPSARQIVRVDAETGERAILAHDPRYDFLLCDPYSYYSDCAWHGDWLQVRRLPFQPQTLVYSLDVHNSPEARCLEFGWDCGQEPALFALNWRTGELTPWDDNVLPTPIPVVRPTPGPGSG